jgi:helix-turn-helix protein
MANENPVYLKLEYEESLESKKDILSLEISFLNVLKIIKQFDFLREQELNFKIQLYKQVQQLSLLLRKTKSTFPFFKVPHAVQQESEKREVITKEKNIDRDLESQLRDIQEKLRAIS